MINLLKKNKQLKIVMEFSASTIKTAGDSPEKYLNDLRALDFKLYNINAQKEKIEPIDNIASFIEQCQVAKDNKSLLCLKGF